MSNIAKKYLQDRDIKNLIARSTQYKKVVGNPKELYILVSPKGNKTFSLRYKDEISKKDKFYKIGEWRESIFTTQMARAKAIQILRDLNNGDTTFETLKDTQDRKYTYENLFYGII